MTRALARHVLGRRAAASWDATQSPQAELARSLDADAELARARERLRRRVDEARTEVEEERRLEVKDYDAEEAEARSRAEEWWREQEVAEAIEVAPNVTTMRERRSTG